MKNLAILAVLVFALIWFYFLRGNSGDWEVKNNIQTGTTLIAFGDSLTQGQGAPSGKSYPDQLSQLLGIGIVNKGLNGDTTVTALKRLEKDVLDLNPNFVFITLGGNDIIRRMPVIKTTQTLGKIFQNIQATGAMVIYVAINPPFVGDNWIMAIKSECKAQGVLWVEPVMKDLWGKPNLMTDEIHPNEKGYAKMAQRIYEAFQPYIPE